MKRFALKIGIPISLFIGIIGTFPRVIRFEINDYRDILLGMIYHFFTSLLLWILCQLAMKYRHRYSLIPLACATIFLSILCSIAIYVILQIPGIPLPWLQVLSPGQKVAMLSIRGLLVGMFLFFISYYLRIQQEMQWSKIENEKLKRENISARMEILKQQMTPHFLFNALNTLTTITAEEQTREYTIRLAHVYRHLLQYNDSSLSTLRDELNLLRSYLYIQQTRFEDALLVRLDIPEELQDRMIPVLTLQILVENAIKHNVATTAKPLFIDIEVSGSSLLAVKNNLQPKRSTGKNTGKGLRNISDRYLLVSGKPIGILPGKDFFTVIIPLLSP